MLGLSAAVLVFSVGVHAGSGSGEWDSVYEMGSKDRILTCGDNSFLTGICATTYYRYCKHWGNKVGNMIRCTQKAESRSRGVFKLGDFGQQIECDLRKGEAAISACSSGGLRDCKCSGNSNDGCNDQRKSYSHMLKCSSGLDILSDDTKQIVASGAGDRIECPSDYVIYRMCSSGRFLDCKDDQGKERSHTINCVRVASGDDEKDVTKEKLITSLIGYWKPQSSSNSEFSYQLTTGVESTEGVTVEKTDSQSYGFSQELSLGLEASYGTIDMSSELSVGFNQEFSRSVSEEVSSIFTQYEEESTMVDCGASGKDSYDTLWQWYWKTKTATGDDAPAARTNNYLCAPGNEWALQHKPRCVPGHSLNGAAHTVCTYDYCDIVAVRNSTIFHFNRACVDRKLDRRDWGHNPDAHVNVDEAPHVEYHRGEHLRDGSVVAVGFMTLRRDLASPEWKEEDGDAWGAWSPHSADSRFQVGDTFRILSEWEEPTSAASHISALIGLSTALLAIFVAF